MIRNVASMMKSLKIVGVTSKPTQNKVISINIPESRVINSTGVKTSLIKVSVISSNLQTLLQRI